MLQEALNFQNLKFGKIVQDQQQASEAVQKDLQES